MDTLSYKTKSANKETINKKWLVVDAKEQSLGRLSSNVAYILRGKHKTDFTPHVDCGDYVIVINAEQIVLTGNKMQDRQHFSHTEFPGGQKKTTPQEIFDKKPEMLIENSVRRMLPKNKLGRALWKNLHVYVGSEHPHEAQKPTKIDIKAFK